MYMTDLFMLTNMGPNTSTFNLLPLGLLPLWDTTLTVKVCMREIASAGLLGEEGSCLDVLCSCVALACYITL
jgi:hypothetical protein